MLIKELIPSDELICTSSKINLSVESCISDYTKADSKSLLFLLPGVNFNTYELAEKFQKSAPRAIVTENPSAFKKSKIPLIEVKNARRAFAFASSRICEIDYSKTKFIGVTGTNGKTSTALMIKHILEANGNKCGFIGTGKLISDNRNLADKYYSMTCPDPNLLYPSIKKMQEDGCTYIIMEVSSHALALEKVSPISFDIGIFTGLSHEHLEFHKNMDNYFAAKEKLIKNAKRAIINFDDKYGKKLYEKYEEKSISIGIIWNSDVNAINIENAGLGGIGYICRTENFMTKITLRLPGIFNVYNSLSAFCCAYLCNVKPKDAKTALSEMRSISGRFEIIFSDINIIIDYAHTPRALDSILNTVYSDKKQGQKMWIVFGCGGERDREKRPMMAAVAEKYADKIIVTNDNPRNESEEKIISDILPGFQKKSYAIIMDRALAITYAIKTAKSEDFVIIAGKGHEKYILDKRGYRDFDEVSVIKSALKLRNSEV